jgi:hypothetical protein
MQTAPSEPADPNYCPGIKRDTFEYAGAAGGFLDRYGYPFCRGRMLKMVEKDYGQYDTPEFKRILGHRSLSYWSEAICSTN